MHTKQFTSILQLEQQEFQSQFLDFDELPGSELAPADKQLTGRPWAGKKSTMQIVKTITSPVLGRAKLLITSDKGNHDDFQIWLDDGVDSLVVGVATAIDDAKRIARAYKRSLVALHMDEATARCGSCGKRFTLTGSWVDLRREQPTTNLVQLRCRCNHQIKEIQHLEKQPIFETLPVLEPDVILPEIIEEDLIIIDRKKQPLKNAPRKWPNKGVIAPRSPLPSRQRQRYHKRHAEPEDYLIDDVPEFFFRSFFGLLILVAGLTISTLVYFELTSPMGSLGYLSLYSFLLIVLIFAAYLWGISMLSAMEREVFGGWA